ncbi:hypothetical protein C8P65_1046 [Capnocytophaga leadbetteri]|uniref:Uncharacterized protein n=1 Tax=Capnocytophaga leadbetteri TaxID=327575 RepID=A0A2T5XVE8_9FLAO|nr:hypothetical protein C8P65_1046 [Capnocytophaga leadbetteri]
MSGENITNLLTFWQKELSKKQEKQESNLKLNH